jgi:hypothetical protein
MKERAAKEQDKRANQQLSIFRVQNLEFMLEVISCAKSGSRTLQTTFTTAKFRASVGDNLSP